MSDNREEMICRLLRSTQREGIDSVIEEMHKIGFFTAPASTIFHLNVDGGLAIHSYNVCKMAMNVRDAVLKERPGAEAKLQRNSVVIAALLHDVCKADIYVKAKKYRKNEDSGRWESYDGYNVDYSHFPVGHGEKSVIMLLKWGLRLTDDEIIAIRWHMTAWDLSFQSYEQRQSLSVAAFNCPLLAVIQAADGLASHILEV